VINAIGPLITTVIGAVIGWLPGGLTGAIGAPLTVLLAVGGKRGEHRMVMHLHGWWLILYYPWFLLLLAASPFLEKRLATHFGEERTQLVLGSTLILLFIFPVILCVVRLTRYAILSFYLQII